MLLWRVQLCGLLPQPPVGLRRVVSLLALAVGRKMSVTRCSSPTGGGPKWDQVIWRRTVDANGTVIEDIGVNFGDRRATLFRRLPKRTDTKTKFWYCDDAEVVLSWRSKYFQQGGSRSLISLTCLLFQLKVTTLAGS